MQYFTSYNSTYTHMQQPYILLIYLAYLMHINTLENVDSLLTNISMHSKIKINMHVSLKLRLKNMTFARIKKL